MAVDGKAGMVVILGMVVIHGLATILGASADLEDADSHFFQ